VRSRNRLSWLLLAGLLAFGYAAAARSADPPPLQDLATYPRTRLEIKSAQGTHVFQVWLADTPERQEQGLMFVRELAPDQGMLFTHCCTGIWMRNTYIELDIVFLTADGRIRKIAERARPFDETTLGADAPNAAVVELKGGEAALLKLKPGDKVSWEAPGR